MNNQTKTMLSCEIEVRNRINAALNEASLVLRPFFEGREEIVSVNGLLRKELATQVHELLEQFPFAFQLDITDFAVWLFLKDFYALEGTRYWCRNAILIALFSRVGDVEQIGDSKLRQDYRLEEVAEKITKARDFERQARNLLFEVREFERFE